MALSLTLIGLLVLLSLPAIAAYRLWLSPLRGIPGPLLARCSIVWKLWHVWNDTYRFALQEAHDKYGPFVRTTYEEVSICNDEAEKKVLVPLYDKGSWYRIFGMPDTSYTNQMNELNAAKYCETRKKLASGYSMNITLKNESKIDGLIKQFHNMVEKFMSESGKWSPSECFTFFAFDVTATVTFSGEFGFLTKQRDIDGLVANSDQLCNYLAILGFFPTVHDIMSRYVGPLLAWFGVEPMKHVVETTKEFLARHGEFSEKPGNQERHDMVSSWRAYQGSAPLTERQIFAASLGNVAAGGDTVSSILQALLWYILHDENVKVKLEAELSNARADGLLSSPAQYSETLKLPYFQACLKETFRIHPLNPSGSPRIAPPQGVNIDGQYLPGGTVLNVNAWIMHYNKNIYGEDVCVFKPERWLEPDTATMERNLIPFSTGYMTCPGRHLATIEMCKLMATLFLEYDISLVDPTKDWHILETVVTKASGWEVKMTKKRQK